jgi:phosphatidate cytidylyltransferase
VLHRRLLSAAVLLAIVLVLIALDLHFPLAHQYGLWMIPLMLAFTLGTAWEFAELLSLKWHLNPKSLVAHCVLACGVCLFPFWYSLATAMSYPADCPVGRTGWVLIGVLTGIGTSGIHALSLYNRAASSGIGFQPVMENSGIGFQPVMENTQAGSLCHEGLQAGSLCHEHEMNFAERTTLAWFMSCFVMAYVVGCMNIWLLVRMQGNSLSGMMHMVSLLAITKFADTGAYFAGKTMGRTKLIPKISPGKTVEGLIGGMVMSVVVAYVLLRLILPSLGVAPGPTWWGPALLGCLLTLVGLVGDLLESMVKRTVGAKDSGVLLPGLGGVWDVTDSLLPTAIVGYLGIIAKLT